MKLFFKLKLIPLFILAMFLQTVTYACKCFPHDSVSESQQKADAVFVGKVTSENKEFYPYQYTLQVSKCWKGVCEKEMIVYTGTGDGDCGVYFEIGSEYLVYASKNKGPNAMSLYRGSASKLSNRNVADGLTTDICTRTAPLDPAQRSKWQTIDPLKDIDELGKPTDPNRPWWKFWE